MNCVFSPRAARHLREIGDYIAKDDPEAAARLIARIESACKILAGAPAMGRRRPELGPRLRSFPLKSYIIFYQASRQGIVIHHILHARRSLSLYFKR